MSATTAVKADRLGRLGAMVRTSNEIYLYWRPSMPVDRHLVFRVTDLTGLPVHELLDGTGRREFPATESVYVSGLPAGHIYLAEVGRYGPEGFTTLLSVGPVQTPWVASADFSDFPSLYYRS